MLKKIQILLKSQKKRGRKPHLNADGLPLTDEEKKQRTRNSAKRIYENNFHYRQLQKACYYERKKAEKKIFEINFLI